MANTGRPNTGGSQFFLNVNNNSLGQLGLFGALRRFSRYAWPGCYECGGFVLLTAALLLDNSFTWRILGFGKIQGA